MRLESHACKGTKLKVTRIPSETSLYVASVTPATGCDYYVLFVHGGPGSHSAYFEAAIQKLPAYQSARIGWVVYDQRGCGRSAQSSPADLTHADNMDDLASLCRTLPGVLPRPLRAVFGHSYGARLTYDTFKRHAEIDQHLILAGRSVYGADSMNLSTLMDLYILRDKHPEAFARAYEIVSKHDGDASDKFSEVRALLDEQERQRERGKYYWGNQQARSWYEGLKATVPVKDNDAVFEQVRGTYTEDHTVHFNPASLTQKTTMVKGYWDFLMAGATTQGLTTNVVTFNGSGHFPHFEEPEKFVGKLQALLA